MNQRPTLRRELIGASAVIFAGALAVAILGVLLVVPGLPPAAAAAYVFALLVADVLLFATLGARLLRRRLLQPLDRTVVAVEAISRGALDTSMPEASTAELGRLSAAVSQMAEHLLENQRLLTENIRSLDETNRQLTEARDAMVRAETMASVGRLAAGVARKSAIARRHHRLPRVVGRKLDHLAESWQRRRSAKRTESTGSSGACWTSPARARPWHNRSMSSWWCVIPPSCCARRDFSSALRSRPCPPLGR
jgi:HAMP domain-containing protein